MSKKSASGLSFVQDRHQRRIGSMFSSSSHSVRSPSTPDAIPTASRLPCSSLSLQRGVLRASAGESGRARWEEFVLSCSAFVFNRFSVRGCLYLLYSLLTVDRVECLISFPPNKRALSRGLSSPLELREHCADSLQQDHKPRSSFECRKC